MRLQNCFKTWRRSLDSKEKGSSLTTGHWINTYFFLKRMTGTQNGLESNKRHYISIVNGCAVVCGVNVDMSSLSSPVSSFVLVLQNPCKCRLYLSAARWIEIAILCLLCYKRGYFLNVGYRTKPPVKRSHHVCFSA